MQQSKANKIIAGAVIIVAVALIAVAASVLGKKDKPQTSGSDQNTTLQSQTADTNNADESTAAATDSNTTYKDGTYTASETYMTEGGQEGLTVTLTVANNAVSDVSVKQDPSNHESEEYQSIFESSYKSKVVGKALNSLQLSRISGASDTTNSFNDALDAIRSKAQA